MGSGPLGTRREADHHSENLSEKKPFNLLPIVRLSIQMPRTDKLCVSTQWPRLCKSHLYYGPAAAVLTPRHRQELARATTSPQHGGCGLPHARSLLHGTTLQTHQETPPARTGDSGSHVARASTGRQGARPRRPVGEAVWPLVTALALGNKIAKKVQNVYWKKTRLMIN